jgi:ethanolaminephosphotransferase
LNSAGVLTGLGSYTYLAVIIATVNFFFSTWETYYTGTLFLGYINGPTEGLLISIATLLVSGVYGPQTWKQPMSTLYFFGNPLIDSLTIGEFSLWTMCFLMVFTQLPVSIYRALKACRLKGLSRTTALANTIPYLVMLLSAFVWTYAPGSTVMPNNTILFLLAWGIANGKINALLILRHVTHTGYPTYHRLVFPFVLGAFLSVLPLYTRVKIFTLQREYYYIIAVFLFVAIDYVLWAMKVVEQFCHHLRIKCFSIKKVDKLNADDIPLPEKRNVEKEAIIVTPTKKTKLRQSPSTPHKTPDTPRRITRSQSKKND